jgi:hypothetical protein
LFGSQLRAQLGITEFGEVFNFHRLFGGSFGVFRVGSDSPEQSGGEQRCAGEEEKTRGEMHGGRVAREGKFAIGGAGGKGAGE